MPELAWDFPRASLDLEPSEEDDEGSEDRPYWLHEVYTRQLRSDGLIEDEGIPLDSELHFGDEDGTEIDDDPKPFGHATALGEEYLKFLDLHFDSPGTTLPESLARAPVGEHQTGDCDYERATGQEQRDDVHEA